MRVTRRAQICNAFPRKEFGGLGSSELHARFQEWERNGLFLATWKKGLAVYDELEGIAWKWQSADGVQIEAPLAPRGCFSANPPAASQRPKSSTTLTAKLTFHDFDGDENIPEPAAALLLGVGAVILGLRRKRKE